MRHLIGADCFRHRGVLALRAARGLRGLRAEFEPEADERAALDHVSGCARCAVELKTFLLADHALRGLVPQDAAPGPAETAWPRLRATIERSGEAARAATWRWRMNRVAAIAAALIVGLSAGPRALSVPIGATEVGEPTGYSMADTLRHDRRIELTFAAAARTGTLAPSAITITAGTGPATTSLDAYRNYPDSLRPQRKEVRDAPLVGLPPGAS